MLGLWSAEYGLHFFVIIALDHQNNIIQEQRSTLFRSIHGAYTYNVQCTLLQTRLNNIIPNCSRIIIFQMQTSTWQVAKKPANKVTTCSVATPNLRSLNRLKRIVVETNHYWNESLLKRIIIETNHYWYVLWLKRIMVETNHGWNESWLERIVVEINRDRNESWLKRIIAESWSKSESGLTGYNSRVRLGWFDLLKFLIQILRVDAVIFEIFEEFLVMDPIFSTSILSKSASRTTWKMQTILLKTWNLKKSGHSMRFKNRRMRGKLGLGPWESIHRISLDYHWKPTNDMGAVHSLDAEWQMSCLRKSSWKYWIIKNNSWFGWLSRPVVELRCLNDDGCQVERWWMATEGRWKN